MILKVISFTESPDTQNFAASSLPTWTAFVNKVFRLKANKSNSIL